jgi:hypothetical protein
MKERSPRCEWLITEIESELGMIGLGLEDWTESELEGLYDNLIGSMYNGIMWSRC